MGVDGLPAPWTMPERSRQSASTATHIRRARRRGTVTRFLLVAGSVHATAAACDYLEDRLTDGDVVTALALAGGDREPQDADDATNVATARLSGFATVEAARADGDAVDEDEADAILSEAADGEVDEVVVGAGSGSSGSDAGPWETVRRVVTSANVPVVVVPLSPRG